MPLSSLVTFPSKALWLTPLYQFSLQRFQLQSQLFISCPYIFSSKLGLSLSFSSSLVFCFTLHLFALLIFNAGSLVKCLKGTDSRAAVPNLSGTPVSWKRGFPRAGVGEGRSRVFKCIVVTVHFVSIIITSAPPWIIRHQIPEVGDPCPTGSSPGPCTSWCHPDRACLGRGIWERGFWTNNHG